MNKEYNLIYFYPQHWGEIDKFVKFSPSTYHFSYNTTKAVSGVLSQIKKSRILLNLAHKLSASLNTEDEEIKSKGYTIPIKSNEVATIIEAVITSLYSSLNCLTKVLHEIYKPYNGVSDRTSKLFSNAMNNKLDKRIPINIINAFKNAEWYLGFRRLRSEIVHSETGSCFYDSSSDKLGYMHAGLGTPQKAMVIDDIYSFIDTLLKDLNIFYGLIFHELNISLVDLEMKHLCGVFSARLYYRKIKLTEAKDFNSGTCDSYNWFEKSDTLKCPFSKECGAYLKLKTTKQSS